HEIEYGAAVSSAPRFAPSSVNCTPATATLSLPVAVTVTVPLTVAPAAGAVTDTVGAVVSGVIVSVRALEVPPPGAGVKTRTDAVPARAASAAVTVIRSCVALTKVVERLAPLYCTTELEMKPVPVTVRVKLGEPAGMLLGVSDVADGA